MFSNFNETLVKSHNIPVKVNFGKLVISVPGEQPY